MNKSVVLDWLRREKIVPVVRAPSLETAMRVIEGLLEGGISILEVTMTVPNAVGLIEQIAGRFGDEVLLGAGTVLTAEQAEDCIAAGAKFIVAPMFDLATVETCRKMETVVAPGALTPSEVWTAWSAGADVVKVFPCDALGGATYLRSLKAPFPQVQLMPTGGVTLENIGDFVRAGAVAVGVGSNLVDTKLSHPDLVARARSFVERVKAASEPKREGHA